MFFNEAYKRQASGSGEYEIKKHHGQFGVVGHIKSPENDGSEIVEGALAISEMDSDWVVEPCYDNIFKFDRDVFILYKHRKLGAVHCIDRREKLIAHCQYDKVDSSDYVLVFFEPSERLCYFRATQTVRIFSKISFYGPTILSKFGEHLCYFEKSNIVKTFSYISFEGPEDRYISAGDANYYYIIDCYNEAILWSCPRNDSHLCPWDFFSTEPCLTYMGETEGLPMFFDCSNCTYIVPTGKNKLDFASDFPNVITPIIVQGENIVNIIDNSEGVNAADFKECIRQSFVDNEGFDEVTVDIRVTLKSETRTEVRYYAIPNGTFFPGDVVDLWEWNK